MRVHVPGLDKRLLDLAMQAFYWLRDLPGLQKKPSTSELIDWVQALARGGVDPEEIAARLPFMGVLLKKDHDVDVAQRALASGRGRGRRPPGAAPRGQESHAASAAVELFIVIVVAIVVPCLVLREIGTRGR